MKTSESMEPVEDRDHDQGHEPPLSRRPQSQPKLLPAFEPFSSSSPLAAEPRPPKRTWNDRSNSHHYPTPVPTSDTAVPTSSPPGLFKTRPALLRTLSTISERQPLGTLPSIHLSSDGKETLMGRSSCSSHHQLSANRAISRVHVRALYRPASDATGPPSIFIECIGWNGCKIHCQGKIHELAKGDTFSSDRLHTDILLDVQDARVMLRWPDSQRKDSIGAFSDATWEDENSPTRRPRTPPVDLPSSPPLPQVQLQSPVSPSPRNQPHFTASSTFIGMPGSSPSRPAVQVYEDASGDEDEAPAEQEHDEAKIPAEALVQVSKAAESSSSLSSLEDFSDNDEENDPVIHSFGPFGDNLLPRMASINAAVTPKQNRRPLKASTSPQKPPPSKLMLKIDVGPIKNHVINQLAYGSRNSMPLSAIMRNLPSSMKTISESKSSPSQENEQAEPVQRDFTEEELKQLLDETPCVGEIAREGKDAAGKVLEDEYYYVPEMDTDLGRRDAVENSLGKTGLRSVRKQHKQYFWKRPRH